MIPRTTSQFNQVFSQTFPAQTKYLESLATFLQQAGVNHPQVILAIHEFMVNAIRHGQASFLQVKVVQTSLGWQLTTCDDGLEFDLTRLPTIERQPFQEGGFGLQIITKFANRIQYWRIDQQNCYVFDFRK